MQLILKHLEIENVKGVQHDTWDFINRPIYQGDNGIGKTTMLDSTYYMLCGKTLMGTTFDPKSKRFKGPIIISLDFTLNGVSHNVKRLGERFQLDGVEMGSKAYFSSINELVGAPMEIFTNPNYLLSIVNWEETRETFVQLFGELNEDLVNSDLELRVYPQEVRDLAVKYNYDRKKIKSESNSKEKIIIREESKLNTLKSVSTESVDSDLKVGKEQMIRALQSKINVCESNLATFKAQFQAREVVKNEKHTLACAMDKVKHDFATLESKLVSIQDGDYKCETCKQGLQLKDGELEKMVAKYQQLAIDVENAQKKHDACVLPPITLEDPTNELHVLRASLASNKADLKKYDLLSQKKDDNAISKLEEEVLALKVEANTYITTLEYLKIRAKVIAKITGENINKNFPEYTIVLEKVVKQTGESKPDFDILDEGVSYKLVNHAKRIQMGLDVVSRIQDVLGWNFPILADGLESILEPKCSKTLIGTRAYKG